METIIGCKKW